jgi:ADP-ribose pyrophosphatase YjhB (NUDIX family)
MKADSGPRWLEWAREIQALSQTGLAFTENQYQTQRYQRLTAIAAEIVQSCALLSDEPLLDTFTAQPGYATPKVDVRGAVVREGRILLVQERADGRWSMPGGWADVGSRPSEMVVREVREESGFEVLPRKLIGVYDANRSGRPIQFFHAYKLIWLCDITGGHASPSNETLAVDFFSFNALPELSTERTHRRHLNEALAHLGDPSRPPAFD